MLERSVLRQRTVFSDQWRIDDAATARTGHRQNTVRFRQRHIHYETQREDAEEKITITGRVYCQVSFASPARLPNDFR